MLLTQPLDVIKTRLMTQGASDLPPYASACECVVRIWRDEGPLVFTRGMLARLVYVAPFGAIQFAVNEQVLALLQCRSLDKLASALLAGDAIQLVAFPRRRWARNGCAAPGSPLGTGRAPQTSQASDAPAC